MTPRTDALLPLSPTDFHVLMVLVDGPLYGYAILKAVEEESEGTVSPEIGSLYRVLARLMEMRLVEEVGPPRGQEDEVHRGRPRRYYRITAAGLAGARAEAGRMRSALELARSRRLLQEGQA